MSRSEECILNGIYFQLIVKLHLISKALQLEMEKILVNLDYFFLLLIPHPISCLCLIPKESSREQEEMETKKLAISCNLVNFEQDKWGNKPLGKVFQVWLGLLSITGIFLDSESFTGMQAESRNRDINTSLKSYMQI